MYSLVTLGPRARSMAPTKAAAPQPFVASGGAKHTQEGASSSRGQVLRGLLMATYYDSVQRGLQFEVNRLTGKCQSLADLRGWTVNQAV